MRLGEYFADDYDDIKRDVADFYNCEIVYQNCWSDYEEAAFVVVFDLLGDLYVVEHHEHPLENEPFRFNPEQINEWDLKDIIKLWEGGEQPKH